MTERFALSDDESRVVKAILHHQPEYISMPAIAGRSQLVAKQLMPEARLRHALANLIRKGVVLAICRRVYVIRQELDLPFPHADFVHRYPEATVALWAIESGRDVTVSVEEAEHYAGRRIGYRIGRYAVSGIAVPLALRGLALEPAPDWVWRLPAELHIFAQGLRQHIDDADDETLQYYGATFGKRAQSEMAPLLRLSIGLMPQPLRVAARATIEEIEAPTPRPPAARKAPPDFLAPPPDDPETPSIDLWRVLRSGVGRNYEVLSATFLHGHPRLGRQSLARSSPLLWIDVSKGYARTLSRIYRLGLPADWDPSTPSPIAPDDRLFIGIFPAGILYADRSIEIAGDYKRLAFLAYDDLVLQLEPDYPASLLSAILAHALTIQARKGGLFQVSQSGQTVRLGWRLP